LAYGFGKALVPVLARKAQCLITSTAQS